MNTQHTPGPWHVGGNGSSSARGATRVWARDKAGVCEILTRRTLGAKETPEMDANARLIAAAPDLLAALREVYANRSSYLNNARKTGFGSAHGRDTDVEIMVRVRAAIAKAEGVQS